MIAFFNHFKPKRRRSVPMTVRSTSSGTHWTSAVPRVATSRASVAAAANAPSSELRQLTVTPTTRTMVNASTNSTAEAKNEAVATTHCIKRLLVKTYCHCSVGAMTAAECKSLHSVHARHKEKRWLGRKNGYAD